LKVSHLGEQVQQRADNSKRLRFGKICSAYEFLVGLNFSGLWKGRLPKTIARGICLYSSKLCGSSRALQYSDDPVSEDI
jgi:hypothetical protein